MSELLSVLSGRGNEPLAFESISSLTGLMVNLSNGASVSLACCPDPQRLRLLSASRFVRSTLTHLYNLTFAKALMSPYFLPLPCMFSVNLCYIVFTKEEMGSWSPEDKSEVPELYSSALHRSNFHFANT